MTGEKPEEQALESRSDQAPAFSIEMDEPEEEKLSPEMQEKIEKIKEVATQKAAEILKNLEEVQSKVTGWDADDQPDYKKTIAGQADFAAKTLSKFSDESKTVYLLNGAIEESARNIIKSLNDKIDRVERFEALPDDEKTVQQRGLLAATAGGSLEIRRVLTSADWVPAFATIKDWKQAVNLRVLEDEEKEE